MIWLILGLMLWVGGHLFKRVAPAARASLGKAGKGVVAAVLILALVLIVLGYRWADWLPLYTPLPGMGHLNNLLMLVAIWVYSAGMSKGVIWTRVRHPQLTGTAIWAVAHLLVNGDVASVLLFGTMLVWALAEIRLVSRAEGPWVWPASGGLRRDLVMMGIALLAYGLIAGVHIWTGHNPFAGNYA